MPSRRAKRNVGNNPSVARLGDTSLYTREARRCSEIERDLRRRFASHNGYFVTLYGGQTPLPTAKTPSPFYTIGLIFYLFGHF